MKKLIILSVIALSLASCSKSDTTVTPSAPSNHTPVQTDPVPVSNPRH